MMSAAQGSGLLVLSREVEIVRVREFPRDIRQRLGGHSSDFIVSHHNSRVPSRRIEEEAAMLLRQFVKPRRIVEAVIEHSAELQRDPAEVLNEAYEMLRAFRAEGILVDPEARKSYELGPSLALGELFEGWKIIECISGIAETEVYKAESKNGSPAAIKYLRTGADEIVKTNLRREATVLEYLNRQNSAVAPRIYDSDVDRDDPYICMEWFSGCTLFDFYQSGGSTPVERARVIPPLLDAYRHLHGSGVLHGDVHPRNVLILTDDTVRLVDFSAAVLADVEDSPTRIGVVQYYEPEVAIALLEGLEPPQPTESGEQYVVANLAYSVITQTSPLLLSLETETALKQIASEPPRRFSEVGVCWPAAEAVLIRALSKSPTERFATFDDFSNAFSEALSTTTPAVNPVIPAESSRIVVHDKPEMLEEYCQRFVKRYGLASVLTTIDLIRGPTASLYAGATGIAYALNRMACLRQDPALVAAADVWISWAEHKLHDALAFTDGSVGAATNTGPLALFHSATGVYAIKALIRHASGDEFETRSSVKEFVDSISADAFDPKSSTSLVNSFSLDATNGAASLLLGAALLAPLCQDGDAASIRLRTIGNDLCGVVIQQLKAAQTENHLLGFAHGRTGAVYSLLRWAQISGMSPPEGITDFLDELAASGKREGHTLAWPIVGADSKSPVWTGWCHGSAGHILTWTTAAKVLERAAYLEIALAAGHYIWESKGQSGPSLCCGAAGEALSLFELARASGDHIWIDRGLYLAKKAVEMANQVNEDQGLFRADVGIALAACEAISPDTSSWPICQSP